MKIKNNSQKIMVITFCDFLILYQSVVISSKNGIFELPNKLPNDLGLKTLGKP